MNREDVKLIELNSGWESEFLSMVREYVAAGENPYSEMYIETKENFQSFATKLFSYSKGLNLPAGEAAVSTFWLVRDDKYLIGDSRLRHRLTLAWENEGGHIEYGIRPLERQKGYGSLILALTLQKARQYGLNRVLLTCDGNNVASVRIIEKNGGAYIDKTVSQRTGKSVSRYWIDLL